MDQALAVEAPQTEAPRQPNPMVVSVAEDTAEQEAKTAARLRELAPQYRLKFDQAKRAESDYKHLRTQLTYHFAIYKAIHVGKGRDGNWKNFVEEELKLPVRTVDRWVADKVKLASGELPAWVVERIKGNMDPEPEPTPEPEERPLELKLLGLTDDEKAEFNTAMDKFQPDVVSRIIFEAVTKHEAVTAPKPRKTLTMGTEETENDLFPIPERVRKTWMDVCEVPPTVIADLEQRAAVEATA